MTTLWADCPRFAVGDIIWIKWRGDLGWGGRFPWYRDYVYVRARVVAVNAHGYYNTVEVGTSKTGVRSVHALDCIPFDVIELLAHADGNCPFCLGTKQLITRFGIIEHMCHRCSLFADTATLRRGWVIDGVTASNAMTLTVTMPTAADNAEVKTWLNTAPRQAKRGFRARGECRYRPEIDREEAADRRRRMKTHSRRHGPGR